ncbi:zinc ribbon domain-containing protein [Streptomyces sp. NPDC093982]|uniref:zinc ribbon domain-containing protein n=1 Tax=Streptomyces sp. NPDC093982 TaxID=3155077 RepID=UPI0034152D92
MAPPRTRPHQRGPVHGHARGEGSSRLHVAAVCRLRLRHRNKPRKPAVFRCKATDCGHTAHADIKAAINIKHAAGHAVSACRDLSNNRSVKQEPVGRATDQTPA